MSWQAYEGDSYLDFPAVMDWCKAAQAAFPKYMSMETIGESRFGRPIVLLTLAGDSQTAHQKPALWLDAGTHASEWTGVMTVLYTLTQWLRGLRDNDPSIHDWFSKHTAYVVPCIAPDGYQALFEGSPYIRSTLRPHIDGTLREGFEPMDINGDGAIRLMRWKHPAGAFVPDNEVPMFMRPRQLSDDPNNAYFVTVEGQFRHWDGVQWKASPRKFSHDLNRNFPSDWEPFRMFGMDSGAFPLSEPESRAVVDAFHARPNIAAALTHHTYTGCILTQPYREPSPLSDGDILLMEALANDAVEGTGYRTYRVYPEFAYDLKKPVVGVWSDTISTVFGVPGYTVELWDPYGEAGVQIEKPAEFFAKPDHKIIRQVIRHFSQFTEVVQPWTSFTHPQLGPVEIGGIDPLRTVRNPPISLLAGECKKGHTITERVCNALPRVQVSGRADRQSEGVSVLKVNVENMGFLPTSGLQRSEVLQLTSEVRLTLSLSEGLSLIEGAPERALGHLDGWGNTKVSTGRHYLHASLTPRGHRTGARWVLQGKGIATIKWRAGRAGYGTLEILV